MKIGIMGGTFDPIHNGHIHIAKAAYEEYGLDRVWLMTAGDPYFKQGSGVSAPLLRYEMTSLAAAEYPDMFESSDMELRAKGHTYSADTFMRLHELYPADTFFFILGFDSLRSLASWRHPEILLKYTVILCALRDNSTMDEAERLREKLYGLFRASEPDIRFIHTPLIDISSTMLRQMVREGLDISSYVPASVLKYIQIHKMYKK